MYIRSTRLRRVTHTVCTSLASPCAALPDGAVSRSPPSAAAGRSSSGHSSARTNCTNSGQWPGEKNSAPIPWYVNWHGRVRSAASSAPQSPVEPPPSRARASGTLSAAKREPCSAQASLMRAMSSAAWPEPAASACASAPDAIAVHARRANISATGPYPPWSPAAASAARDPCRSGTLADRSTGLPANAMDAAVKTRSPCARSSAAYQDRKKPPYAVFHEPPGSLKKAEDSGDSSYRGPLCGPDRPHSGCPEESACCFSRASMYLS
uniref:Uncharacterized protein n=1 Tax=Arundo donax TaxID=35708 RepID=A0A0A9DWN5_ARUDO